MRWRTTSAAAALLTVGTLLGWLAGSGRLDMTAKAGSSQPAPVVAISSSGEQLATCCDRCAGREAYLVRGDVPAAVAGAAKKQDGKKPNILIIWGDDIGWFNPSCYHGGVMGYQT